MAGKNSSTYGNELDFTEGVNKGTEYGYNVNGNLIKDLNKKSTDIQYNVLNLPCRIQFENGSIISYLYNVDEAKLRTTHVIENNTTITDYCGNVIYENGIPDKLLTGYGYISLNDKKYHYFIRDHQGNNRVVVEQGGEVEELNHYYPFGGLMANSSTSIQPYKYNGKELGRKNELDWYDYGARHYDVMLARWHTIDLLAEKYNSFNPYNYCGNNLIRYIDPDGKGWNDAWPFLQNNISTKFTIGLRVGASVKLENIGAKLEVNMGSVEFGGSHGKEVTSGISATIGAFGVGMYDSAYELDSSTAVKEEGYTVGVLVWEEDHKETTTYDSRGIYYEEIKKENTVETTAKADLSIAAYAIMGLDFSIDLISLKDFL